MLYGHIVNELHIWLNRKIWEIWKMILLLGLMENGTKILKFAWNFDRNHQKIGKVGEETKWVPWWYLKCHRHAQFVSSWIFSAAYCTLLCIGSDWVNERVMSMHAEKKCKVHHIHINNLEDEYFKGIWSYWYGYLASDRHVCILSTPYMSHVQIMRSCNFGKILQWWRLISGWKNKSFI